MEKNDSSIDEDGSSIGRWREYVSSYVAKHPTEWIPTNKDTGDPYLARSGPSICICNFLIVYYRTCTSAEEDGRSTLEIQGDMPIRVSCGKYKLFFEAGSEWYMRRWRSKEEMGVLEERATTRREERRRCRLVIG